MSSPGTRERERKRQRPRVARSPEEPEGPDDGPHSDDDVARHGSDDLNPRPGQAERKRELERNRRNLVNVRFVELEAELRRCVPVADPPPRRSGHHPDHDHPAPAKGKRIDKEAVLKDAAQRLAVQRKDLTVAAERMASMATEIENLRAEKVELRGDKSYLRSELETVRGDVQRLRSDNINLWQAFKKASSIKDAFAPDVAKIPAELFLRTSTEQVASTAPMGNTMVQQCAPLPVSLAMQMQNPSQTPQRGHPPPRQRQQQQRRHSPLPQQQLRQQQQLPQQRQQQSQQQTQSTSPLLSDNPSREMQHSISPSLSAPVSNQVPSSSMNSDSFLILQSPEELGDFFNNYVPGAMVPNFPNPAPHRTEGLHAVNNPRTTTSLDVLPASAAPQTLGYAQTQYPQDTQQVGKSFDGAQQNPFAPTIVSDTLNGSSPKAEKEEEPFSDIAYCV